MKTETPAKELTPEWEKYYADLDRHEEFYNSYKFYLDRMLRHLEWRKPSNTWTTEEIRKEISDEISRALSMDAPNKPGYYRANND